MGHEGQYPDLSPEAFVAQSVCGKTALEKGRWQKMKDWELARQLLEQSDAALVVVKEGQELTRESGRGVLPLLRVVTGSLSTELSGAALADKVIGQAAAFLAVRAGLAVVFSPVMSQPGLEVLTAHGIEAHYETLVENIMRQEPYGLCLMEQTVAGASGPDEAFNRLVSFFADKGISL